MLLNSNIGVYKNYFLILKTNNQSQIDSEDDAKNNNKKMEMDVLSLSREVLIAC